MHFQSFYRENKINSKYLLFLKFQILSCLIGKNYFWGITFRDKTSKNYEILLYRIFSICSVYLKDLKTFLISIFSPKNSKNNKVRLHYLKIEMIEKILRFSNFLYFSKIFFFVYQTICCLNHAILKFRHFFPIFFLLKYQIYVIYWVLKFLINAFDWN
jgi:hypothetical protein